MMGEQLKPCPFCGGDAELQKSLGGPFTEDAVRASFRVVCSDHGCQGGFSNFWHTTPEEAVGAWNRRAERTCYVDSSHVEQEMGDYSYLEVELSCGHAFTWDDGTPPDYCPNCGAKVVGE